MKKAPFHLHSIFFSLLFFGFMMMTIHFFLSMISSTAYAAEASLAWDANSEQDLAGYKIYYKLGAGGSSYNGTGANEGNSPVTVYLKDLINSNSPAFSLTGLGDGLEYSFAVTAFLCDGLESDFSNQAIVTTPLPVENQTPHSDAGADQTVAEGETVYLSGANSKDLEGAISSYQWRQVTGPTVVLIDAESVQASFITPGVGTNGVALSFELQITDDGGLSDVDTCTVNVTWLNNAPTASAGPDRSAIPNELVMLDGSHSYDPDGGMVTYQWSQKQGPLVSISNTAIPCPTFKVPESAMEGTSFIFELTVRDSGGLIATDECNISIALPTNNTSSNKAPVASAGPDQTVSEGRTVYLSGANSTDPEGGLLQYRWKQVSGPAIVLDNTTNVRASFTAPDVSANGVALSFELHVTDKEGLSDTNTCIVNVTWLNNTPTASAGPDRTAIPNEVVTLDGGNSFDLDDGIITYQWSQKQGPAVKISNPLVASPIFKVPESATVGTLFVFELTIKDSGGLISTDECRISITLPIPIVTAEEFQGPESKSYETKNTITSNTAPIASAGPDRTAIPEEIVSLDGSESYDAESWIAAYQWSQKQGPVVNLIKGSTGSPRFKVPKTAVDGTVFIFELAVTDTDGLTSKDECSVKITKPFSIASAVDMQDNASIIVETAASEASNEQTDDASGDSTDQTVENTRAADSDSTDQAKIVASEPDAQTDKQYSDNSAPNCPMPEGFMGNDPLLLPVELAVDEFIDPNTGDCHSKTQWQVYRTEDKLCVLDIVTSSHLTVFRIPEIMLDENTAYFWRARFFDNHNAASEWSKNVGFATDFSDIDTDGNGIPDDQETGISVDMNSDGISDGQQAIVKSILIPSCNEPIGLSIEKSNTATAILSMSAADAVDFDLDPEDEDKINRLPYGLINFKLAVDRSGDTVVVTVHFSQPVSKSAKWVKFDPFQGVWLDYSAHADFSEDGMSVDLEFEDGGCGDDDGVANGIIVDPSGLDFVFAAESFSTQATSPNMVTLNEEIASGGDSGSGGCFVAGVMKETTSGLPLTAACILLLGAVCALRFGNGKLK